MKKNPLKSLQQIEDFKSLRIVIKIGLNKNSMSTNLAHLY